jgi:hypothetical protein
MRVYSGAESRLGRGVRSCVVVVGGGAVVPSEADVAEDRGDYATFFVGCEAGGGVCRHGCGCVVGELLCVVRGM